MSMKMTVNASLQKKLDEARMKMALRTAMTQTMIELRDTLARAPTPKKTGNLRRSNTYEVNTNGSMIEGIVRNHAPYWVYVNYGTSKMAARDFVGQAIDKVQPAQKIHENFNKIYKS